MINLIREKRLDPVVSAVVFELEHELRKKDHPIPERGRSDIEYRKTLIKVRKSLNRVRTFIAPPCRFSCSINNK